MTKQSIKKLAVFCGGNSGQHQGYILAAQQFAKELVQANISLVYGGAKIGIMGAIADCMLALGGHVIGVIPQFLVEHEIAHPNLSQLHIVTNMQERKSLINDLSDGFVMLPGGMGSLDEFFEMNVMSQLGFHNKPCAILNSENYFDKLIDFLDHSVKEGFVKNIFREKIMIDNNAKNLLQQLIHYQAPMVARYENRKIVCT